MGLAPNRAEWDLFYALVEFCREQGAPRCFAGWPELVLKEYLLWHLRQGTLAWVCAPMDLRRPGMNQRRIGEPGRELWGVGMIWPTTLARIHACTRQGECVFTWEPADWAGSTAIYICEWIVRDSRELVPPGKGRREVLKALARTLWVRHPEQRGKPMWYSREGKDGRWESKRFDSRLLGWAGLPETKEEMVYG